MHHLPSSLVEVAQAYARDYYHTWGSLDLRLSDTWIDAEEFESQCDRLGERSGAIPGLYKPCFLFTRAEDDPGLMTFSYLHRTHSGRSRWELRCDSKNLERVSVSAWVSRPAGDVAEFLCDVSIERAISKWHLNMKRCKRIYLRPYGECDSWDCRFQSRHMDALTDLILPLLGLVYPEAERDAKYNHLYRVLADFAVEDDY